MSVRGKAGKGSLLLMAGEGVSYGASFLRNMILARLLARADFGIAATFGMVMMLFEFSTKLGIARFVVRDKEGNEADFVEAAHGVQALAALLSALLIAAAAPWLAALFGIPDQAWVLASLAFVALLRGLEHLDVRRYERELRFGPSLLVEVIPQVAITILAWPLALWLGDYRVMFVLLLLKAFSSFVASHLLRERPYRWRWHREYVVRMLRFGWPLVVNGFLMLIVMQGDKYLVPIYYGMDELAPYAAAAALVMAPTFMFGRVFNSVALPLLARVQDDAAALERRYRQVVSVVTLFSVASGIGLVVAAEPLMRLVYGPRYIGSGLLLAWIAAANAFRTFRIAPSLAAIAKGDSANQMISNCGRIVSLAPAFWVAATQRPLWMLAAMGLIGEALACSIAFVRLKRRDGVAISASLVPALQLAACLLGGGALVRFALVQQSALITLAAGAAAAVVASVIVFCVTPELRQEAGRACTWLRGARDRRWWRAANDRPTT